MAKKVKLALIDSHALIHRAFHALPPMNAPDGRPTNAVYGFTAMVLKMFSTLKPTHVVAAFDVAGPTFRHKEFEAYKANRAAPADELIEQFTGARKILESFGIPIVFKEGFEADDIIGTLVSQIDGGVKKVIVTGDMDTLQLVDDDTSVFTLKRGVSDTILYDEALVVEKYGFGPEFVIDYKGLRGDPSDNIPGVAGIGDKTARELVGTFGHIEDIYEHLQELPKRAKTRLTGKKEEAVLSRRLATILRDVSIDFSLEDARLEGYDTEKVRGVFMEFGFKSLLDRLPKGGTVVQPTLFSENRNRPTSPPLRQGFEAQARLRGARKMENDDVTPGSDPGSSAVDDDATENALPENYHLVQTQEEKSALLSLLQVAQVVAFDTETEGLGARKCPIIGVSFAFRDKRNSPPTSRTLRGRPHSAEATSRRSPRAMAGTARGRETGNSKLEHGSGAGDIQAYYVPVTQESVQFFQAVLEDPNLKKVGHNLKYDCEVLLQSGIRMSGIIFDSMIAGYLLSPGSRQYSLDAMALTELNHHTIPITDLIGAGKDQKKMSQVPLIDLARYAAEDADVALRLYESLVPRIEAEGLKRILDEIEVPLVPVLSEIEMNGVKLDTKALKSLGTKVERKITKLEQQIWKDAGGEFNIKSTQQLKVVLFEKLNLPTVDIKRTQSGYSTAASELEKLHGTHPIIERLEEYRELTKLQSTYITTLPKLVDKKTGRIYTSFNQVVAATGRLSSQDPNLQNIPVRTELGQEIRKAFVADAGNVLVKADYSQVELRIAAHMSQDAKLIETFRAGEDIHRATAAWVFGIALDEVTDKQRREAKTLNFGVLYGMGPQGFARGAGISVEEARSFIGRYREQYKGLAHYIDEVLDFAREHEYVTTLMGRKRQVPEIHSSAPQIVSQAERMAFNFPIQGTAADILKKAMIQLQGLIGERYPKVKMLLTVHDELVCEVPAFARTSPRLRSASKASADKPEYTAEDFAKEMKRVMESVITLDVPLIVDVAIGENWQETRPALRQAQGK